MALLHIVVLAIVQGATEFLPISSSGHLVLTWEVFDAVKWQVPEQTPEARLAIDIAVHVGTLAAVCLYFWRDVASVARGTGDLIQGKRTKGAQLALLVAIATVPLAIVGLVLRETITQHLHNITIVALATIAFGVVLYIVDRWAACERRTEDLSLTDALIVGLFQVLALIPGTSRSGITMTAARLLGVERTEAARFGMLLAIPALAGPGLLIGFDLYRSGNVALGLDAILAAALAFVFALLAIALLMRWLAHAGFAPFCYYRVVLGIVILMWANGAGF